MDMWMWALLVLVIVAAITWYVLARRGKRPAASVARAPGTVPVAPVAEPVSVLAPVVEPGDDSWAARKPKVEWDEPEVAEAPSGQPVVVTPADRIVVDEGASPESAPSPEEPQPTEEAASGLVDWRAAAEAEPEVEQIWDGPFGPGSAEAGEDGEGPLGWTVKAARQTRVYLTPEVPVYTQARANIWFVDEQRAIDAGFRRWDVPNK